MKKQTTKRTTKPSKTTGARRKLASKKAVVNKVDYYPNRMTLAVSALAGTSIVLLSLMAALV